MPVNKRAFTATQRCCSNAGVYWPDRVPSTNASCRNQRSGSGVRSAVFAADSRPGDASSDNEPSLPGERHGNFTILDCHHSCGVKNLSRNNFPILREGEATDVNMNVALRQNGIDGAQFQWRKLPACDVRSQIVGKQDAYPAFDSDRAVGHAGARLPLATGRTASSLRKMGGWDRAPANPASACSLQSVVSEKCWPCGSK